MHASPRIPLQVGTGSFGYTTGAVVGGALALLAGAGTVKSALSASPISAILGGLGTALLVAYTVSAVRTARRLRASDLVVTKEGISISGGPRHGRSFAWSELAPPFAQATKTGEHRVELAWILVGIPLTFLTGLLASAIVGEVKGSMEIVRNVVVTRLRVRLRSGEEIVIAESDDPEEGASLEAARDTVAAAAQGRRAVEEAPFHPVRIVTCPKCGAAVVPADAPAVQCAHCSTQVAMTDEARKLAASARETTDARAESHHLVASLLEQPDASSVDAKLRLLSIAQILVWPLGWAAVAWRARTDGWNGGETLHLLAPTIAVLALWFIALGAASERRALRALTLGFGALAPAREGDAPRCRRCHAPLGAAAGIASCAYCRADNVVGIDLRSAVDAARRDQPTFDEVLAKRRETRVSAIGLRIVAVIFALFWLAITVGHVTR